MAEPLITLWSDVPAASGAQLLDVVDGLDPQDSEIEKLFDETGHVQFVVEKDARWLTKVELLHVLHVVDPLGDEHDFRVQKIYRGRGPGRNRFVVAAEPIAGILGDDLIHETTSGGETNYLLGGSYTPEGWVATQWLPVLHAAGKTWIDAGTFDYTQEVVLADAVRTTLSGLRELEGETKHEFQFERQPSGLYLINLVERVGSTGKRIVLSIDRQLEAIDLESGGDRLATEVVPMGAVPDGGTEAATIGRNAWKVTNVNSGTGELTLAAPRGGDGPFLLDGQFAESGREGYLVARDGTLHKILGTTAPDKAMVGSPGSFTAGDYIEVRADASATLVTGLRDPTAARILQRTWPDTEHRGERNYVPNPAAADGTHSADSVSARVVSYTPNAPNTDVSVKELPPGATITAGHDVFIRWGGGSWNIQDIVVGGTADGSGNLTITVQGTFTPAANDEVQIYRQGTYSAGWENVGYRHGWHRIRLGPGTVWTAAADGTQSTVRRLAIKGFAPGESVYTGYAVDVNGTPAYLLSGATADGSGNVELELSVRVSVTDDDPITIEAPSLESEIGAGYGLVAPCWKGNLTNYASIFTPWQTVLADPVETRFWYSMGLAYLGTGGLAAFTGIPLGPYSKSPAVIRLAEDFGGYVATIDGFSDAPRTLDTSGVTEIELSDQYTLTSTKKLRLQIQPVLDEQPNNWKPGPPFTVLRWSMMHFGPDGVPGPVDGSYATPLWQLGNRILDANGPETGSVFELYGKNLALDSRYVTADEKPTIGADALIYDPVLDVDKDARVLGHRWWPGRTAGMKLIVDTRPLELTKLLEEG